MDHHGQPQKWGIALVLCSFLALCITFGSYAGQFHADALIPVLVSLVKWTPYYWLQNRFGMLVPLLAWPVHHAWANLLVQAFLCVAAGLALMLLLPRVTLRRSSIATGLLGILFLLLATTDTFRFEAWNSTPYGVSMALVILGLALLQEPISWRRLTAGGVCFLLSSWVNTAAPILGLFLVAAQWIVERRPWRSLLSSTQAKTVGLLVAAAVVSYGLMQLAPYRPTKLKAVPPWDWLSGAGKLAHSAWLELAPCAPAWAALLVLAPLCLILGWHKLESRAATGQAARAAVALLAAALAYLVFVGSLRWTQIHDYAFRYAIPSVLLVLSAFALVVAVPIAERVPPRWHRALLAALVVAAAASTLMRYGVPSPARARAGFDRRYGALSADVRRAGCTHLLGDYWTMWPTMFHANMVAEELGEPTRVWAIGNRSNETEEFWAKEPIDEWRVCEVVGENEAVEDTKQRFGFKETQELARVGGLRIVALTRVNREPAVKASGH